MFKIIINYSITLLECRAVSKYYLNLLFLRADNLFCRTMNVYRQNEISIESVIAISSLMAV